MTNLTQYTIGSEVACGDDVCGKLQRVIVEPIDRVLTHLVVEPKHGRGDGRLVPVGLVDVPLTQQLQDDGEIQLTCTFADFEALDPAQETMLATGGDSWRLSGGVGIGQGGLGNAPSIPTGSGLVTSDRVPTGEVEIFGGEQVEAVDGSIGRIDGVAVDRLDQHVTHVLLGKGHLWGHKTVAIPIGAIANVEEGVQVRLTKAEVRDLPALDVELSP